MSTALTLLDSLVEERRLRRYQLAASDPRQPFRRLYLTKEHAAWLKNVLPGLPMDRHRELTPVEQVVSLYGAFVGEEKLPIDTLHIIQPEGSRVYRLQTTDVRIFGWFPMRGFYVAAAGELKKNMAGRTDEFRKTTIEARKSLGLHALNNYVGHVLNVRELL